MMEEFQIDRTNFILYCSHWESTLSFYRERLNLTSVFENDWFVEFEVNQNTYISIANASKATISPNYGKGITITFQVKNMDQLNQLHKHLVEQNVRTTPMQKKWEAFLFHCFDPEGNRLEFWVGDD